MKIGMSTACFYPLEIEKSIARLAALNVRTIEVFINTESEFTQDFIQQLRQSADANEMTIVSVHPYTSPMEGQLLFSDYPRRTQDGLQQYRRYCAAAQALGAKYLTFHGERHMIQDKNAKDTSHKLMVYHTLCNIAAEYNIVIAQENVAWCKSKNPEYIKLLYKQIPKLGFTLDIKQAHRAGHHWREYVDVMGERLVNVHINDFNDTHSCLLPSEGIMDYTAFFNRLAEQNYDTQVMIEVYRENFHSDKQLQAAIQHLQQVMTPQNS